MTGWTESDDFPVTPGSFQPTNMGSMNAFVTKLNPTGSALIYSTYLGGNNADSAAGLAVNSAGNAYIVGNATSGDFPTTSGAFQTCPSCQSANDVFITELSGDGSALVYSTLLGGNNGANYPGGIALDASGDAYATGATYATDFPTTLGAFQTTCPTGACGGSPEVGAAFLTKLNSTGSALIYSTYLGGSAYDFGSGVVVDGSGDAYVGGYTEASNFPVTSGAFQTSCDNCGQDEGDVFLTEMNPSGSALLYSTFIGGNQEDAAHGIARDLSGDVYVVGNTYSSDFPTTGGVVQPTYGGSGNGFIVKFSIGSGVAGVMASITPPNLDFGTELAGTNSSSRNITLSSTGSATLSISNIGISGADSSDFSQTNNCGTDVAAGTSCTISVIFSPTSTGTMSASVSIADDASNSPQSVSLSGTGTGFSLSAATGSDCPSGGNCSTSATATAGQTATYDLQASPVSGFNGTVTLGCTDALAQSTCSVSPSSATLNGTAATAFAVTVTTTASSALGPLSNPTTWRMPSQPTLTFCILFALALLLFGSMVSARNSRRRLAPVFALLILSLVWITSCGGGGSNGGGGGNSGTPSGTVTITGTSGGVNHSVSLNLTVN